VLQAIASISVRPNSPQWLVDEVAATKSGLLALRQNVVLLRDPDRPDRLYPR
jgi:4-alpha-glucanotransferase